MLSETSFPDWPTPPAFFRRLFRAPLSVSTPLCSSFLHSKLGALSLCYRTFLLLLPPWDVCFFSVFIRMWYLSKVGKCYPAPVITFPTANPASVNMISLGYKYVCVRTLYDRAVYLHVYTWLVKKVCVPPPTPIPVYVSLYDPSHVIFRFTMTSAIRCDFPLILGFSVWFVQFIWFQFVHCTLS